MAYGQNAPSCDPLKEGLSYFDRSIQRTKIKIKNELHDIPQNKLIELTRQFGSCECELFEYKICLSCAFCVVQFFQLGTFINIYSINMFLAKHGTSC